MDNKKPSSEEIKQKREFAYRAYSPDSEPPSQLPDEKRREQNEPVKEHARNDNDDNFVKERRQSA